MEIEASATVRTGSLRALQCAVGNAAVVQALTDAPAARMQWSIKMGTREVPRAARQSLDGTLR
ncbi:MAG TPA: hypothetical protein VGN22_12215, partial [Pseudonocardia sp.]